MATTNDYLFKILLLGDPGCGKTKVLNKFAEEKDMTDDPTDTGTGNVGDAKKSFVATIGVDFKIRMIELDGKKIKLQIWDTPGEERFRTITTSYYRGTMGIMLVYDITNDKSFENTENWLADIKEHASSDVVTMLIGNKCHKENKRMVSIERVSQFATDHGMKFMEVSAKEDINIDEAFYTLARDFLVVQEQRHLEEGERSTQKPEQSKGFLSSVKGFFEKLGLKSQKENSRSPSSSQPSLQPSSQLPSHVTQEQEQSKEHKEEPPEEQTLP